MFDASVLEVFIASTNDLMDERLASEEVLRTWNQSNGSSRQIILKPLRWEKDATPELGPGGFQEVINCKLLDNADILIGIIGKRLGSPTKNSIAGTVEEIDRFYQAKKPVLLFFSTRPHHLDDIDPEELKKVREFQKKMQDRGLYLTFASIDEFKDKLRNSLDDLLKDFQAMLLPASRALAYGYYRNFVHPLHTSITDYYNIVLPDFLLPDTKSPLQLCFSKFHLHIAKPLLLDDVSNNAAKNFGKDLAEISIRTPRRAFRIYVRSEIKSLIDKTYQEILQNTSDSEKIKCKLTIDCLEVLDYPTPLIALKDFVDEVEKSLMKGQQVRDAVSGYWRRQKTVQHESFYEKLSERIMNEGLDDCITFFVCGNNGGWNLPQADGAR